MGHKDHVKPSAPSKPYDTYDSPSTNKNVSTRTNDYWYISFDEKEKGKVSTNGETAEEVKQHNDEYFKQQMEENAQSNVNHQSYEYSTADKLKRPASGKNKEDIKQPLEVTTDNKVIEQLHDRDGDMNAPAEEGIYHNANQKRYKESPDCEPYDTMSSITKNGYDKLGSATKGNWDEGTREQKQVAMVRPCGYENASIKPDDVVKINEK